MKTLRNILLGLILPVLIVLAWWIATTYGNVPGSILPPLNEVGQAFKKMWSSGQLQKDILISLSRVVKGYGIAVLVGISIGTIAGMSGIAEKIFMPTMTTIRQIPMIAWIPLIILWCGIGETSKVVIIVLAAFFPILVNTYSGIRGTPDNYIEVARMYKLGRFKKFIKLYLPHAVPNILVGLKLGLGVSWMAVVASELVAAVSGIGYRMNFARTMMHSDKVIVCMIVVGLIGILMDKLLSVLFELITPWEKNNRAKNK